MCEREGVCVCVYVCVCVSSDMFFKMLELHEVRLWVCLCMSECVLETGSVCVCVCMCVCVFQVGCFPKCWSCARSTCVGVFIYESVCV